MMNENQPMTQGSKKPGAGVRNRILIASLALIVVLCVSSVMFFFTNGRERSAIRNLREAGVLVHFNHIPSWCPHSIAETFPALFGETVAIFDVGFGAPPLENCHSEFQHLSRIEHLSIEGPGIDDKWFSEFGTQRRVKMVFIGNTGITSKELTSLKKWTGLKSAHFQQNKGFTDTIAESSVPDGCQVTLGE